MTGAVMGYTSKTAPGGEQIAAKQRVMPGEQIRLGREHPAV